MSEKIRIRQTGWQWSIEVLSAALGKWIIMASWPTIESAERDLKLWMTQREDGQPYFELVP